MSAHCYHGCPVFAVSRLSCWHPRRRGALLVLAQQQQHRAREPVGAETRAGCQSISEFCSILLQVETRDCDIASTSKRESAFLFFSPFSSAPTRFTEFKMLGDASLALIQDSARSQTTSLLRPYLDEPVRQLARETRSLSSQLQAGTEILSQIENDDASVCQLTVAALTMRRNKRALLLYHSQRLELLKDLFWDSGIGNGASNLAGLLADTANTSAGDAVRRNISTAEMDFFRAYAGLVREYKTAFIDSTVDISAGTLERPPKDLHVQVRVLKDIGDIETEQGSLSFRKGTLVFVRRADVERLLASGLLEEVAD